MKNYIKTKLESNLQQLLLGQLCCPDYIKTKLESNLQLGRCSM